jgi:putative NADPH-quinone reductase
MSLLETSQATRTRYSTLRNEDYERTLIVNGHPDPRPERFCAALCAAYLSGAVAAGRNADVITLGTVFPPNGQNSSAELTRALDLMIRPAYLTVIFPLWLDKPPEIVTRFFHHVARSDEAHVKSRSAHILVTMSLPAFAHRSLLRDQIGTLHIQHAMSLPDVEINALNFVGSVDSISLARREEWLCKLRCLGRGKR